MKEKEKEKEKHPTGFGTVLRRLREEQGLTQQDLAVRAGCTVGVVSRLERDLHEPNWRLAVALARALGASLDQFAEEPEPAKQPRKPGRPRSQDASG